MRGFSTPVNSNVEWRSDWFVLQTAPQKEMPLAKLLEARGLRVCAPRFPLPKRAHPDSIRSSRPRLVFPGYLFLKVQPGFSDWDSVQWTAGVRRILQHDKGPAAIDDSIINHLESRLATGELSRSKPAFRSGQPVLIERGAMAAVDAIFDQYLDTYSRVRVLVEMMGRSVPVQVDLGDLRQAAG
jgi:transcription antitermination factor NusG